MSRPSAVATPPAKRPRPPIERWAWVAIYGGVVSLVIGISLLRHDAAVSGHVLLWGGLAACVLGVVLILVRARMPDADDEPSSSHPPRARS